MKYIHTFILFFFSLTISLAQMSDTTSHSLPYEFIESYPGDYNQGSIIARMIDGLGYRYYWATEGLSEKDLDYKPSEDSRTIRETLSHIYGLSSVVLNAAMGTPNGSASGEAPTAFADIRRRTLENCDKASKAFMSLEMEAVSGKKIIFNRGENSNSFPLWHLFNGPLADAIQHVGQIVGYRRAAGNPQDPKVNVFMGKNRGKS